MTPPTALTRVLRVLERVLASFLDMAAKVHTQRPLQPLPIYLFVLAYIAFSPNLNSPLLAPISNPAMLCTRCPKA